MYKLTKDSLPFFNQFNFKKFESMNTHRGVSYRCGIFFNKKKIADVENRGLGGETTVEYAPGGEDLLNSIAEKVKGFYDMTNITFDIDNEYILSDLVEVKLQLKDILRGQSKAILFITPDDRIMQIKFKTPFSKFKAANKFDVVLNKAKELTEEGNFLLNTNIK